MALLDFMKDRKAGQQQGVADKSQEQKPQNAKEMYTQQAAQEKATQRPVEQIPEADKAKAREVGQRIEKATQHLQQDAPAQPSVPTDGTGGPEPMRQTMAGQDKSAPSLSPTSAQAGTPATQKSAPSASNEPSAKPQEKSAQRRQQTVPRPRPSWER
jgi:hypothetical protein